uniref:hypothetical protein n=1 Tax=Flavobacterium sp. TaxID=239 RepID=UPI00404A6355
MLRYEVDLLKDNGYDCIIVETSIDKLRPLGYIKTFWKLFQKRNSISVIDLMDDNLYFLFCRIILKILNINLIFYRLGNLPYKAVNLSQRNYKLNNAINFLCYKLRPTYSTILYNDDLENVGFVFSKKNVTKYIRGNALDYRFYFKDFKSKTLFDTTQNYIVFIDQNLQDHPDFKNLSVKIPVEFEYDTYIKRYLDYLAFKFSGKKVIVLGHPNSLNKEFTKYGYDVIYDSSIEYITKAYIVVSHYSTLLNCAIFYQKRILLISTAKLNRSRYFNYISGFADALGLGIVDISNVHYETDFDKTSHIDLEKYIEYKYKFICGEFSENKRNYELLS